MSESKRSRSRSRSRTRSRLSTSGSKKKKRSRKKKKSIAPPLDPVELPPIKDPKPLPQCEAVRNNDEDLLRKFIREQNIIDRMEYVNEVDIEGKSPIHYAVGHDHYHLLELIIDYGADVTVKDDKNMTPLHYACAIDNKKAIKKLINHGASILAENWQFLRPHQVAAGGDEGKKKMLAYVNGCQENFKEMKKEKKTVLPPLAQRAYARSLFDIVDKDTKGVVTFHDIQPYIAEIMQLESKEADPEMQRQFWMLLDVNRNGVLNFQEFLVGVMKYSSDAEKARKKARRKGKKKKPKKKKNPWDK